MNAECGCVALGDGSIELCDFHQKLHDMKITEAQYIEMIEASDDEGGGE